MPLYRTRLKRKARFLWRSTRSLVSRVNETPVIILGKEKSGTTAIGALLARHTGLSVTLDIREIWGPAEVQIRNGNLHFRDFVRRNRYAFARDIVKEPTLTFLYPQVRDVFPAARLIMIVRDPRDNIRSVFNRMDLPGSLETLDARLIRRMKPAWRVLLDAKAHGLHAQATYVEIAAARWNMAADVYLQHRDDMTLVRYEDFVCQKAETIMSLADALQLPHVNDISEQVDVRYQRPGNRAVRWADFFGTSNLARIGEICGSRMQELGYGCVSGDSTANGHAHTRQAPVGDAGHSPSECAHRS